MNDFYKINFEKRKPFSAIYIWLTTGFSLVYIVVAFGLSGISGVSRLSLYSAVLLFLFISIKSKNIKIPLWLFVILFFYVYIALPAFSLEKIPFERIGTLLVVLVGTISIGIALQNNILSYNVVAYGAMIAAIINIVAVYFGIDTAPKADVGRYSGFMANPNALSIRMAFAAFLIWIYPERFNWATKLFGLFIAGYGMYISGSRKGLLLAAALFILVFIDHVIKISKTKFILYFTFTITLGIALSGFITEVAIKFSTNIIAIDRVLKAFAGKDTSYIDRLSLIDVGLKLWKDSPLFGHGFDQFAMLSGFGAYAHNNYVELAVSGGVIAITLFYSLHLIIIRNAIKLPFAFGMRLIICLAAILLMDTALVSFYDKAVMCMLGVLLAISSKKITQTL